MKINYKIFLISFITALLLLFAWFFFVGVNCIALKIKKQNAIKGITVTGNVKSTEDTAITTDITAKIEKITINEGDFVNKGQILAYLNREEIVGEVETSQAKLLVAQAELKRNHIDYLDAASDEKRYKELYKQGAVSKRDLEERTLKRQEIEASIDQKKQEIKAAQGEIKSTQGKLNKYIIKAPFSGYITDSFVSTGEVISSTNPLFRIIAPENIYLDADIEENEISGVQSGQKVLVIFDAYPEKIFEQKLYLISKEVNPVTGTFKARISRPDKPNLKALVGMTFDATIIIEEYSNILIIPDDFVQLEDNKAYVFKKRNLWAQKTPVEINFFNNNRVKILKGIKENDIILKKAEKGKLTDKQKIKIIEAREQ
ncbi:MAG TPA: efflux RND transporter periplasmic adaptor subunit [Candidatus Gastranaerophilales bacterium]|nr:efflux RND transporter periplasmic adaptor subunit [Candidatus Gastranaerophilales bacterium]